jgi:hypothetical protein
MTRFLAPCVILIATLLGCGKKPAADEQNPDKTYTLKLRDRVAGDRFAVTETGAGTTKVTEDVGDGMPKTHETSGSSKYVYTEELLEVPTPGGLPTKARRTYSVAEQTSDGKPDVAPFQGKSVLIQPDKEGYEFRLEPAGELIFGPHAMHLGRQYNPVARAAKPADLLPGRPVRVGEAWDLDREVVGKRFVRPGAKLDPAKTTATGKLTRTAVKDGHEFGEITFDLNLALLDDAPPGPELRLQPGSTLHLVISAELCIDGTTSDAVAKVTVTEDVILRGENSKPREARIHMDGHDEITTTTVK